MYTIGTLARRAKVHPDSVRFYERQGLLSPATKTASGYRLYTDEAVRRIMFIKQAQQCGFSLAEVGELLQMHNGDPTARADGYRLAAEKQADIQKTIVLLQAMSEALSGLLATRVDAAPATTAAAHLHESPLLRALNGERQERSSTSSASPRTPAVSSIERRPTT